MAKRKKKFERVELDTHEIARAVKKGNMLKNAESTIVYSLSNAGTVFSAMTFRGEEYTSGTDWRARARKVSILEFVAKYDELGFRIRISRKPDAKKHRVNYSKALRVGSEGF